MDVSKLLNHFKDDINRQHVYSIYKNNKIYRIRKPYRTKLVEPNCRLAGLMGRINPGKAEIIDHEAEKIDMQDALNKLIKAE